MSSSQIAEYFNYGPNLGIADFTANSIQNEIMWKMFKKVVDKSKLSHALRADLPRPDELTCQAS